MSELPIHYITFSHVLDIRERHNEVWQSGVGKDAKFKSQSLGYFVLLEGSYEAIHLGAEPPELKIGDRVKITIEKEASNA